MYQNGIVTTFTLKFTKKQARSNNANTKQSKEIKGQLTSFVAKSWLMEGINMCTEHFSTNITNLVVIQNTCNKK